MIYASINIAKRDHYDSKLSDYAPASMFIELTSMTNNDENLVRHLAANNARCVLNPIKTSIMHKINIR